MLMCVKAWSPGGHTLWEGYGTQLRRKCITAMGFGCLQPGFTSCLSLLPKWLGFSYHDGMEPLEVKTKIKCFSFQLLFSGHAITETEKKLIKHMLTYVYRKIISVCIFREIIQRERDLKRPMFFYILSIFLSTTFKTSWLSNSAANYSSFLHAVAVWLNTTKILINGTFPFYQ